MPEQMKSEQTLICEIIQETETWKVNALAWREKGNKAAAQRARKASSELSKLLKEWRKANLDESR